MSTAKELKQNENLCRHCEQVIPLGLTSGFCCAGCEQVYRILNESGLSDYYSFRALENQKSFEPASVTKNTFEYFNDPEFTTQHVRPLEQDLSQVNLFLLGVQCAACVWLVEKLPDYCPGVVKAELNFSNSTASIVFDSKAVTLQEIAESLNRIGYFPEAYHPSEAEQHGKKQTRLLLLQLGVAGFCAGNTMLLAVALYQGLFTGIANEYRNFLHWVSFALTLPAVFFSAQAFFKAAIASLRLKRLHIDFPISLGIAVGFAYSTFNMLFQKGEVYFDSICMLIFLLLIGRYLQKISIEKACRNLDVENILLPDFVRVKAESGHFVERYIKSVQEGDLVKVLSGETVPVDGRLIEGNSEVSNAFLTGESEPVAVCPGAKVFAGAKNISSDFMLQAESSFFSSRVYKIITLVKNLSNQKSITNSLVNNLSSWFVVIVLSLSIFCFFYWAQIGTYEQAFLYSISLLIVTCPCALGLAAPLVIARAVSQSARHGILIKSVDFFDLLLLAKNIYFDKTGTLTNGDFQIKFQEFYGNTNASEVLVRAALLERSSQHPIRTAFIDIELDSKFRLLEQEQSSGLGLKGRFSDQKILLLGSERFMDTQGVEIPEEAKQALLRNRKSKLTSVLIAEDNRLVACLGLGDTLRSGVKEVIQALQKQSKNIFILSGDNKNVVEKVAADLDIKNIYSELSPEEKSQILGEDSEPNCMLGDGANDAPALKSADVSIGVGGGSEVGLLVSDCFLTQPKAKDFQSIFENSNLVRAVIRRNVVFSLAYNVIGAGLAFFGFISPLVAAILMPLSSFTVILSAMQFRLKN